MTEAILRTEELLDLGHTLSASLFRRCRYPWEALAELSSFLLAEGPRLAGHGWREIAPEVWAAPDAMIAESASLRGPCLIGARTELRHGAFLRGGVLLGEDCVVGNSTEIKNSILFDRAAVPHFNYVGDSVLGFRAHLGAGTVISNLKSDGKPVTVHCGEHRLETGLRKCGAVVGDNAEIGCGCVLNPGTVIGRGSRIYPLCAVRGTVPPGAIYKREGETVPLLRDGEGE